MAGPLRAIKGTTGTRGRKTRDLGGGTTSKRGARATERSRGPAVECARGAIAFDGFLDAADSQLAYKGLLSLTPLCCTAK